MFEKASRLKLRFASNKGELSVEQLWDLPLQSKSGFDLDTVAKAINAELKGVEEESFVEKKTNPLKKELELKLDLIKHIINTKMEENSKKVNEAARATERARLQELLGKKKDEELLSLTEEEIKARIEALETK